MNLLHKIILSLALIIAFTIAFPQLPTIALSSSCNPVLIKSLKSEKAEYQAELYQASPSQKQYLVQEIKRLNKEIKKEEARCK